MKPLILIAAGITLALTSCYQQPIFTATPKNNPTYQVSYLFEQDGCRVYRFYDNGTPVYFTSCNGQTFAPGDSTTHDSTNFIRVDTTKH